MSEPDYTVYGERVIVDECDDLTLGAFTDTLGFLARSGAPLDARIIITVDGAGATIEARWPDERIDFYREGAGWSNPIRRTK